ncbi:MAG: CPBP family intramembrane metalloprotease [Oscillospiraceae bacterium]|nr:CPBP family intramembrane metalloprotease [Oscillospiraceae bacterium]
MLIAAKYIGPGLVMAWTYERAGSLWGSVLLHGMVNALAVWSVL